MRGKSNLCALSLSAALLLPSTAVDYRALVSWMSPQKDSFLSTHEVFQILNKSKRPRVLAVNASLDAIDAHEAYAKADLHSKEASDHLRAVLDFTFRHPPSSVSTFCYFTPKQLNRLVEQFGEAHQSALSHLILWALSKEATCTGQTVPELIEVVSRVRPENENSSCAAVTPTGVYPNSMEDLPFWANFGSAKRPEGICYGFSMFSFFFKKNFVFHPEAPPLTSMQAKVLFSYEALKDKSGNALRAVGFRQDNVGRFLIPGYANVRELTAAFPERVVQFQNLFAAFYDPVDRPATTSFVAGEAAYQMACAPQTKSEITETLFRLFDEIQNQLIENGTMELTFAFDSLKDPDLCHSVLAQATNDPDTLLIFDNRNTFGGRPTFLEKRRNGLFLIDPDAEYRVDSFCDEPTLPPKQVYYDK